MQIHFFKQKYLSNRIDKVSANTNAFRTVFIFIFFSIFDLFLVSESVTSKCACQFEISGDALGLVSALGSRSALGN